MLGPLQPSVRISVTDAAGTPLARAVVEHVCNRNGSCDARVETDARGFARLFVTQATSAFERHTVIVHSTGFASTVSAPFTPSVDDPPTVAMVLAPGRTLRGRVVDATNAPVPGARVAVDNPIEADRQWAVEAVGARAYEMLVALGRLGGATCAEDGSFEVHDLPGGPWRVGACRGPWLNGFGLTRRDVAAGTEAVTLTLPPAEATSSLEFTLTDAATGEPVLRFDAALETTYRTSHFERIAPGRFRFLRVPADSWTLRVRAPGYLPIERSGVAPSRDGPGLPIALRAERGCVVRGVVRGAADLGNAVIVFRRTDDRSGAPVGQNREPWSRIAHDGSYAASGFASGVYQPLVRTWDWRTETTLLGPSPPTTLAVSGDAHDLTLDVEVAPIREVFVSVQQSGDADERGTVIPNSRIEIADTAGRLVWTGEPVTRGDGFTAYLPTGTYTARLAIPGASPREKTFEVRDSWLRIAFDVP
ncbi:MAG: carboxypeptidase regulatory-like domain-containing protein [Planctomycetes bacterium]|nr:carboxypeptidase regulatory-like domain-containing protein [Planctomycetota bacterium]